MERAKKIEEIIIKYKIDQIHIHQFDCIPSVFPACANTNKPYIAFIHTGIMGVYDWFEEQYVDFKGMFQIFFKTSCKNICITEMAKKENQERYDIPEEKYIVINNSIKFSDNVLNNKNIPNKVEKFLLISRLGEEKRKSIINAINIFRQYSLSHEEAQLSIVGDGTIREDIEKEAADLKQKVHFWGKRNDIFNIILEHDIVLGLDRCILEAITAKRISVVSGYDNIKGIITPENIAEFAKENFSGKSIKNREAQDIVKELEMLNKDKIKQIVEDNYKFVYENLNLDKNIYIYNGEAPEYKIDIKSYLEFENYITNKVAKLVDDKNYIYKESKEMQEYYEQQLKNIKRDNEYEKENLKNEIEKYKKLYNEKKQNDENMNNNIIFRIYRKIVRIIKK